MSFLIGIFSPFQYISISRIYFFIMYLYIYFAYLSICLTLKHRYTSTPRSLFAYLADGEPVSLLDIFTPLKCMQLLLPGALHLQQIVRISVSKKKMKTVFVGRMGFTGVTVTVVLYFVVIFFMSPVSGSG